MFPQWMPFGLEQAAVNCGSGGRRRRGSRFYRRAAAEAHPAARESNSLVFRAGVSAASFGSGSGTRIRSIGASDRWDYGRSAEEAHAGRFDIPPFARSRSAGIRSASAKRRGIFKGINRQVPRWESRAPPGLIADSFRRALRSRRPARPVRQRRLPAVVCIAEKAPSATAASGRFLRSKIKKNAAVNAKNANHNAKITRKNCCIQESPGEVGKSPALPKLVQTCGLL